MNTFKGPIWEFPTFKIYFFQGKNAWGKLEMRCGKMGRIIVKIIAINIEENISVYKLSDSTEDTEQ